MSDSRRLFAVYKRLRHHFGYAPNWWPGTPFDIFVTAILVQQCDWATAWQALGRLKDAGLGDAESVGGAEVAEVEQLIHPVAFFRTKAARVRDLCRHVVDECGTVGRLLSTSRPTETVRAELLSRAGIGNETADAMLSFAGSHPRFVVDAYTRRAFARIGGFGGDSHWWLRAPYAEVHAVFVDAVHRCLPNCRRHGLDDTVPPLVAALRDVHAQLTELAKHHCTKSSPRCHRQGVSGWEGYFHCVDHCGEECDGCPLVDTCAAAG